MIGLQDSAIRPVVSTTSRPKIVGFTTVSIPAFTSEGRGEKRFPALVQEWIDKGWQPYGEVFVVKSTIPSQQPYLGIALVKYQDDDLNCPEVVKAAKEFIHEPETWETFDDLKSSSSAALPVEFMALGHAVEDAFGGPAIDEEAVDA